MLNCILCCGIPASSKTSWAKSEIAKDPHNHVIEALRLYFNA